MSGQHPSPQSASAPRPENTITIPTPNAIARNATSIPSRPPPGQPHAPRPPPPARRGWTRADLVKGGVSTTLLNSLDNFTDNIPPILNQVDHGKKTHNRDMRGWITRLQIPENEQLWDSLVNTLRSDSTAESYWGQMWDRHLCRYILGIVVAKDKSSINPEGRSLTRQAVNNAIKRELDCHFEPGKEAHKNKSARSKTFRDLFRGKCRDAGVPIPPWEDRDGHSLTTSTASAETSTGLSPQSIADLTSVQLGAASTLGTNMDLNVFPSLGVSQFVHFPPAPPMKLGKLLIPSSNSYQLADSTADPLSTNRFQPETGPRNLFAVQYPVSGQSSEYAEALRKLRTSIKTVDDWGQTEWWTLSSDGDVRKLPSLLIHVHLFELRRLLLDFRWIMRTFECVDFSTGMRQIPTDGYDVMISHLHGMKKKFSVETEGFRLIRSAIMHTLPIIKEDEAAKTKSPSFYAHIATQLTGRLLNLKRRFSNIGCLIHSIEQFAPRPWLRPLFRCFKEPTKMDIKLAVPSNGPFTPHLIVLSDDGKVLVTSGTTRVLKAARSSEYGKINMIRMWDVDSGKCLLEYRNVPNFVECLALSLDKTCVSFATSDGLFFWHLRTANGRITIVREKPANPNLNDATTIIPTGKTEHVLTTHRDQEKDYSMMVLWDTMEGIRHKTYDCVKSNASCIDVSADGELFVSGHENGFIHVWSLAEGADKQPVLSFQSAVGCLGQQPVAGLDRANATPDAPPLQPNEISETCFLGEDAKKTQKIVSICYHERGESNLVTAILKDGKIRIWELPLMLLNNSTKSSMKQFMTTICQAVFSSHIPASSKITQVQWSQKRLYTGGDDGSACEWNWDKPELWSVYLIEKARDESQSQVSSTFISVGRRSNLVATYLTKSPYVTVWDMSRKSDTSDMERSSTGKSATSMDILNETAYRPYCPMSTRSVDAMDIVQLGLGKLKATPEQNNPQVPSENVDSAGRSGGSSKRGGMGAYMDHIRKIRIELEANFMVLDVKATVKAIGNIQSRLTMEVNGNQKLEVCFEQPVLCGTSGEFVKDRQQPSDTCLVIGKNNGERGMEVSENEPDWRSGIAKAANGDQGNNRCKGGQRKGMAAALQDSSVALFELEMDESEDKNKLMSGEQLNLQPIKRPDVMMPDKIENKLYSPVLPEVATEVAGVVVDDKDHVKNRKEDNEIQEVAMDEVAVVGAGTVTVKEGGGGSSSGAGAPLKNSGGINGGNCDNVVIVDNDRVRDGGRGHGDDVDQADKVPSDSGRQAKRRRVSAGDNAVVGGVGKGASGEGESEEGDTLEAVRPTTSNEGE